MTYRVRIGFRHGLSFLFPHAGVVVLKGVSRRNVDALHLAIESIRAVVRSHGGDADRWVMEWEAEGR